MILISVHSVHDPLILNIVYLVQPVNRTMAYLAEYRYIFSMLSAESCGEATYSGK
jgi:hypothetical protein